MDATGSMADFIVDGDVFRFSLAYEMGWWVFRATGEVAVKLTISAVSPGAGTLTKNYEGEYRVHGMFVPIGAFEEILIQALVSLITQMSTDSELIAFHKNDFIETT